MKNTKQNLKEFFIYAMKLDITNFKESILNDKPNESLIHFFHFLEDLFAIREKLGQKNYEKYSVLYDYYNALKHKDLSADLFAICKPKYAISFPIRFDNNRNKFKYFLLTFDNIEDYMKNKKYRNGTDPNKTITNFNNFLKNKSVEEIMYLVLEETKNIEIVED